MTTEALSAPRPALPHSDMDRSDRLPPMVVAAATPSTATTTAVSTTATSTAGRHGKSSSASPGKNLITSKKAATAASDESQRSPDLKRNELPKIFVKKEPASPDPPSRHRPPRLHLSSGPIPPSAPNAAATPRTANGHLATMQDVGMACLSPGFATHDPAMRDQLQRSISVREQQRSIIESRLQRHVKGGERTGGADPNSRTDRDEPPSARGGGDRSSAHTPRRKPPSSLTIVPPPHRAFANERVVQSAPLHQSFTGRHHHPPSHHGPPPTTHYHQQQVNRLPPISDVFGPDGPESSRSVRNHDDGASRQYFSATRPSYPSPNNMVYSRPREHRSAEEAMANISGGRDDLLPRIIHYGGHQPPTPPSPPQPQHTPSKLGVHGTHEQPPHSVKRRRTREEYERDESMGSDHGDREQEAKRRKKEEFLALCARAWELFHS